MSISTTNIAELPENITTQMQPIVSSQPSTQQQIPNVMQGNVSMPQTEQGLANNYIPMNVHPNPYGNPPQGPDQMPLPEASLQRNPQQQQQQQYNATIPQQELPSRDIPMNTQDYMQDEQIQPNFVPQAKLTSDYIREYEEASEKALQKHEREKYQEEVSQDLFSSLQIPIFVALLYFVFQMPIVSTFMRKHLTFLAIYNEDGNFNMFGLLLKSGLFGALFYVMQYVTHKISTL
jgi:hypothetical protein